MAGLCGTHYVAVQNSSHINEDTAMKTPGRRTGFSRLANALRGLGESVIEARRLQAEYRRRHPGMME